MNATVRIAWAGQTETGQKRQRNEDAHSGVIVQNSSLGAPAGLFVVCDGMGGHANGQEASRLATRVLEDQLKPLLTSPRLDKRDLARELKDGVLAANRAIFEGNERLGGEASERSGTTVVALLLAGLRAWLIHVGDSRAYLTTGRETRLLTTDHNVGNREIERGIDPDEAWERGDADRLTQALGPFADDHLRPSVRSLTVGEDALFLLCTDGVSDNDFVERHEAELLRSLVAPKSDLETGCAALLNAANNANGHDNLTAVLVRVGRIEQEGVSPMPDGDIVADVKPHGAWSRLSRMFSRQSR